MGVQSSKVDMGTDTVTVIFDDAVISIEDIRKIFIKEGFPVQDMPVVLK